MSAERNEGQGTNNFDTYGSIPPENKERDPFDSFSQAILDSLGEDTEVEIEEMEDGTRVFRFGNDEEEPTPPPDDPEPDPR